MSIIDDMKFTETEEYILSNLPNGSDIGEDIQQFGIEVVDALADKLHAEAARCRKIVAAHEVNGDEDLSCLARMVECVLILNRMKRTVSVKQLSGISLEKTKASPEVLPEAVELTQQETEICLDIKNGWGVDEAVLQFGRKVIDALCDKLRTEAARLRNAVESNIFGQDQFAECAESTALRKYVGKVSMLLFMKQTTTVKQLLGIEAHGSKAQTRR